MSAQSIRGLGPSLQTRSALAGRFLGGLQLAQFEFLRLRGMRGSFLVRTIIRLFWLCRRNFHQSPLNPRCRRWGALFFYSQKTSCLPTSSPVFFADLFGWVP